MKDLVSIIMPMYNSELYISESIDSILSQTYKNWELILVDDASKDHSVEIVESYSDGRIRLLKHKDSKGAAEARNYALREATGRWIAFLDSDDLWHPQKLEKQIAFMEKNGYYFTYTKYEEINDTGNSLEVVVSGPSRVSRILMYTFNYLGCLTVMYDRTRVGLIQIDNLKKRNDYALWVKVVKKCPAYLCGEVLAQYRIRESGSVMERNGGLMRRMKYNYFLWRNSEHMGKFCSAFLTGINFIFGAWKTIVYKKKIMEEKAC